MTLDTTFLTSVADVYMYDDSTGEEILRGKTLLDSSIEVTLNATDVRGGKGNALLYTYYNTPDMAITINDAKFNLEFIGATVGSAIGTSTNVFKEETVTLGVAGAGTLVGTALVLPGATTVYAWVRHENSTIEKVTVTANSFTSSVGAENDVVCVRYYALDASAKYVQINANFVPKIGRLVMDCQLADSQDSRNIVGSVQIEIPKFSLSGSFSIAMAADGTAQTPLTGRAFASLDASTGSCTNVAALGTIKRIINNATWYSDVIALAWEGGNFSLVNGVDKQMVVWAIPSAGAPFKPPFADLTLSSGTVGTATISATGLVESVGAGTTLLKATITAKTDIDCTATCTVTS